MKNKAFTLIELLIVVSIIAILAATIIPNFVGFDTEARIMATKTNLDTIRTRITLFRAKEGRYPAGLAELVDTFYLDAGIKKAYLDKLPPEMVSSKLGNNRFFDLVSADSPPSDDGGWIYYTDKADVRVNINEPLDKKWGEYESQKPADW